ncbi:glucose PTS transporter subunit IIA [Enterococcus italicus]|uniref:glucose PTS transporter subunit IIA n=1 Tax=Enterococcus italicus TaxID=246144 RepID=UPI0020739DD0|nr:glucose PTS transporter subunit IIA [Enterococcus italicus]
MTEKTDIKKIAAEIFDGAGGMDNVESVVHCMTRVRMSVRDDTKVNKEKLKAIPGVLGVVDDEQLQVIVGPGKVNKVAQEMVSMAGVNLGETIPVHEQHGKEKVEALAAQNKAAQKAKQKSTPMKRFLKDISNIFVPMIPAFVGSGLIAGVVAVMTNMVTAGYLDGDTWNQLITVLSIIKNGMFSYLAIYTGVNAAQVFGATPTVGGIIGAVILLTGMNPDQPIKNLFTGEALSANQGGILGVIFAVWLLAQLEKRLHQVVPDSIDIIVTPTISILLIGLAEIYFIMPLAGFISDNMVGGINWILNVGGAFSGFVLGALFLPMVMLGLHQILTPIHVQMITETGSTLLLPILAMAGGGQVGAAIALWVRLRKDKELSDMIKGALPVGILGIGEPLIYGVTLPLGKPFITACIGGGIGGAVIGLIGGVGAIAIGPSGVPLIFLIANHKWWGYVLGLLAAYLGGFIFTYFFGIPKDRLAAIQNTNAAASEIPVPATPLKTNAEESLYAVTTGPAKDLTESIDPVFSQKMMGDGYFIVATSGDIYAPVFGTVASIFPTKHAIGFLSDKGVEVMLHMGVDTVKLNGEPFTIRVKEGDKVTPETLVATVNLTALKEANKANEMLVIVTNMESIKTISSVHSKEVSPNEELLKISL